jgi:hypothetical protein
MESSLKRSLRWSLILAILGFILGLGFLVPLPVSAPESRAPASISGETVYFQEPAWNSQPLPDARPEPIAAPNLEMFGSSFAPPDSRPDVLFDIHTISRSRFAMGTDAYVGTYLARSFDGREKILYFTYCHNYDYKKQRARTELDRYQSGAKGFECHPIFVEDLLAGKALIKTPLGNMLSLRTPTSFDPFTGGTISILFTYHFAKVGRNDTRKIDFQVKFVNGRPKIVGPKGEFFDWLNFRMTEDVLGLPDGIRAVDFFRKNVKVSTYEGALFPKSPAVAN